MASLKELIKLSESNYNYKCNDCGSTFSSNYNRISAMDNCDGDEICEQENGCKECKSTNIVEVDKKGNELTENRLDALEAILEMAEEDALNSEEILELESSIEAIFNNILEESEEEESEEDFYECTECDWEGYESDLDEDGNCPKCGSKVEYIADDEAEDEEEGEDDRLEEGMTLKKTTSKQRAKAKKYRNSAAGKKAMKLNLKKRKKFSKRISACAGKGKTFSMKKKTCVKSKKRR